MKNMYEIVNKKSNFLFEKYALKEYIKESKERNNNIIILKQRLYELNMNICHSFIYDYKYNFSKEEMYFIEEFNLYNLITEFINGISEYVIKIKKTST